MSSRSNHFSYLIYIKLTVRHDCVSSGVVWPTKYLECVKTYWPCRSMLNKLGVFREEIVYTRAIAFALRHDRGRPEVGEEERTEQ